MESKKNRGKNIKRGAGHEGQRRGQFPEPTTQRKSTVIVTDLRRFFKRQTEEALDDPERFSAKLIVFSLAATIAVVDICIAATFIRPESSDQVQQLNAATVTEYQAPDAAVGEPEPAETETTTEDGDPAGWTADEAYIMTKMAMAEAEDQDTEGKALVILVILNRVKDEHFPDTIGGVISQRNAFSSYSNGRYDRVEPDDDCLAALDLVAAGWDESQGATFFEANATDDTWHARHLRTLFVHGAHTFYKEDDNEP